METVIQHLHTYFLFPFSIDKQAVYEDHEELWRRHSRWMDGMDEWLSIPPAGQDSGLAAALGTWQRSVYKDFDMGSPAYQDMVFFHPFVRRVFFDTGEITGNRPDHESLLRCYQIQAGQEQHLYFAAEDTKGRKARLEITDLRLYLFANGIGVLSVGVEAFGITASQALWINEEMRKVYPSSSRQIREGRVPSRMALELDTAGATRTLVEERYEKAGMVGFQPPLARTLRALLYFANYDRQEYEPVLDERMIVFTYAAVDPSSVPKEFISSEQYQVLLSRFLYVDRNGADYRYDENFVRSEMQRQIYNRWAHQGTYYGFTSYSNITCTLGAFDCDEHQLREGFLIHRMFTTRYYLMALVTLFYRATLLDFAERTALVSRRLFHDQEDNKISMENIRLASDLRAEFLHFSNYWFFDELANKDEENEHFLLMCREYRVHSMKREIEEEIDKLNDSLHNYFQFRNTEAVNRLAILSLFLGAGAVATGFFGMNFSGRFAGVFFEPDARYLPVHYGAIAFAALLALGTIFFGLYVVASNWSDYRDSLLPRWWLGRSARRPGSLKRGSWIE
ncbi:MAG: hypothetical protein FJW20_00460 [Acidimicrobiia bacterium]|nr:hypothetical protein [Acidimicrobiia bacterium]